MRWALRLAEYTFEVIHKPGAEHCDADGLSRLCAHVGLADSWTTETLDPSRDAFLA